MPPLTHASPPKPTYLTSTSGARVCRMMFRYVQRLTIFRASFIRLQGGVTLDAEHPVTRPTPASPPECWDDRHEEHYASSCPTAEDGRQQSLGEHPSCPNTHFPWESKTASVVCFSLKEIDILDRHMTQNKTKNSVIGPLVASHNSLGVMNQIPSFCHGQ